MLVVVRADASQSIGSGHVMRCLTLAERLRSAGAKVSFVCRDFPGNMSSYLQTKEFEVHLLSRGEADQSKLHSKDEKWLGMSWISDAEETAQILRGYPAPIDWLIIDHYGIDFKWESYMRPWASKIMVIDDLANRQHDCDMLLDQNYYHNLMERYTGLVPEGCKLYLGPQYALLREEFYQARTRLRSRAGGVSNILVFYGGADPTNETEKCLRVLSAHANAQLEINVVTGSSNPNRDRIEELCASLPNVHYHCQVSNMAELMNKADLAFGAGGAAVWERCFLGLPSIVTVTAENQRATTQAVAERGAILYLDWYEKVTTERLSQVTKRVIKDDTIRADLQRKSLEIVGTTDEGIRALVDVFKNK